MGSTTCERSVRLDDEVMKLYCGNGLVVVPPATLGEYDHYRLNAGVCAAARETCCERLADGDWGVRTDQCECGAFKVNGTQKGCFGHADYCPWKKN